MYRFRASGHVDGLSIRPPFGRTSRELAPGSCTRAAAEASPLLQRSTKAPIRRSQLQATVRLESEASIDASASRSAGFTDRPYCCLTATT